jgi:putative SOS response-associated peptidase YedK
MCGRAFETYSFADLKRRFEALYSKDVQDIKPNYNFAPTQKSPIIRATEDGLSCDLMSWQIIPPWEPEFKTKLSTINAKSETVFESRLYKGLMMKRRCIVPLSGFIEWKRDGKVKRPFCIRLKDEPIMAVAGIWSTWRQDGEKERNCFAIMTTAANTFMEKIHDRMPVILAKEDEAEWLDTDVSERGKLEKLMKPCPRKWLDSYEVSTLVNSPKNNRSEVLSPIQG